MKLRNSIFGLIASAAVMLLTLTSCLNGGDNSESIVTNYWNAIVTSFSLKSNDNVATNLSSYNFTIDNYGTSDSHLHALYPNDGIIFNPDSLPYGTIPDSVKVSIGYSAPDSVYFNLYALSGSLGQFSDYTRDSALYFASYPDARLTVVSYGGVKKTYHVKVNVHRVDGDTIKWHHYTDDLWRGHEVTSQRADSIGDTLYWLTEADGKNWLRTSSMADACRQWTEAEPAQTETGELIDLETLYSWHGELLAVGKQSRTLLASTDGKNWKQVNGQFAFENIVGNQLKTRDVYQRWNSDTLSVIVQSEGAYRFAVSADARNWRLDRVIPEGFPIRGFSRPVSVAARYTQGNLTSRLYLVGGVDAQGRLTSSTWSCDGFDEEVGARNWAEFPQNELPAMQGATILEYAINTGESRNFWLLQPGLLADGTICSHSLYSKLCSTLYYSEDSGVSWHRLSRYYSKYADNSPIGLVSAHSGICNPYNYEIYLFGGQHEDGTQLTSMWGGLLPKLSFKQIR